MLPVEFNETNNNIKIYNNKYFKNMNNVITFLSHKINCKMMMPHELVWMNESSCKSDLYAIAFTTWCHVLSLQLEFFVTCSKQLNIITSCML
jgi:hypothetical protein